MIIHVNGQPREVAPPVRLSDVLDHTDGATPPRGVNTELTEGAKVEIVTAVQGG
jgi:sulfur carrier protein ThiS